MTNLPSLDIWVTDDCAICARTLKTLSACKRLRGLVAVRVRNLGDPGETPPSSVVGGPTVVFQETIVSLGTPDCSELTERIMSITRSMAVTGGGA